MNHNMLDPEVPEKFRREGMDYQWINLMVRRSDPEATGWAQVRQSEMPGFDVYREPLVLFCRPKALTERVQQQATTIAQGMLDEIDRFVAQGGTVPRRRVTKPLSSPRGPLPGKPNLRDWLIYRAVLFRHWWGATESPWLVQKVCRTTHYGLARWADDNGVSVDEYVSLHTQAILDGKGRWPGQIIRAASR